MYFLNKNERHKNMQEISQQRTILFIIITPMSGNVEHKIVNYMSSNALQLLHPPNFNSISQSVSEQYINIYFLRKIVTLRISENEAFADKSCTTNGQYFSNIITP